MLVSVLFQFVNVLIWLLLMAFVFLFIYTKDKFRKIRSTSFRQFSGSQRTNSKTLAFFHPNCSAGGGGERVLWKSIQCLGDLNKGGSSVRVAVYTKDKLKANYKKEILHHVRTRFSISIPESLEIAFIHLDDCVKTKTPTRKRFSMFVESIETIELAWRALHKFTPDVFIDTTGCAFTFLIARILANCKVFAYVHYPTISTDMLSLVWDRRPTYNNDNTIAGNTIMTYIKLVYYFIFAICYGFVGSLADLVMVNSTWTHGHIKLLWRFARDIRVVFPPCDTRALGILPLESRENIILSIGQFRPEKDHALQLKSFAILKERLSNENLSDKLPKLVLLGSCRGDGDMSRVCDLKALSEKLNISHMVEFSVNQPYSELKRLLGLSSIGIHTMWNEHFGIGVVEMMAAGLVTIAHATGGPKSDIIVPWRKRRSGYLATSAEDYADVLYKVIVENGSEKNLAIRKAARAQSEMFSDEVFDGAFKAAILSTKFLQ